MNDETNNSITLLTDQSSTCHPNIGRQRIRIVGISRHHCLLD